LFHYFKIKYFSMSNQSIHLPPVLDDSFNFPEEESILISPSIVDDKIKRYLNLSDVITNVNVLISSTNKVNTITIKQLRDIVFTQILDNTSNDLSIDEIVSRGMKVAQHLYQETLTVHTDNCKFDDIMHEMLKRSWIPDSTAKSLTGYLTKYLAGKDNIKWETIKDIFNYSIDDRTLVLIYLITSSYVLSLASPKHVFFESYPGYQLENLDKYITTGIVIACELLETNVEWPTIIIRDGEKPMINTLALSQWFVLSVLALQTGYVGFRLGEKIWKLVHTIVDTCQSTKNKKPITKKQMREIIEQRSKLLLE